MRPMADTSIVLRMFHQVRKDVQIRDRLRDKMREYDGNIRTLSSAISLYAIWKIGTILLLRTSDADECLYMVRSIALSPPQMTDMKPQFIYQLSAVICKDEGDSMWCNDGTYSAYPAQQLQYKEASTADIRRISLNLSVYTAKKIEKAKYVRV